MTDNITPSPKNQVVLSNDNLALYHWDLAERYVIVAKSLRVTHRAHYLKRAAFHFRQALLYAGQVTDIELALFANCDPATAKRDLAWSQERGQ